MYSERTKIVPVMTYADISSTVYTDSINMKGFHKCTFVFLCHTLAGATATLTITSGAAESAYTTAETFSYAWGGAAIGTAVIASTASCDVLAAWASAASVALTYTTYSGFMLVVEIDAKAMTTAQPWLSGVITTAGSVTGRASCVAILSPRYTGNRSATCLK